METLLFTCIELQKIVSNVSSNYYLTSITRDQIIAELVYSSNRECNLDAKDD